MRVLFAAYCMVDNENGDSLIGVYKRATRIGLEMARRGHEVWMLCPGRRAFRDDLTERAANYFHFLDLPARLMSSCPLTVRRRYYRMAFRRLRLDLVVIGEAPMAGELLECALCSSGLGIRAVVLDNAYNSGFARNFVDSHGPMLDGVVLSGPRSFQSKDPPDYYCAAPPYIDGNSKEAETLIETLGLENRRLITVLGYEAKAERLAAALLPGLLAEENCAAIFLAPKPEETLARLSALSPSVLECARVLPLPSENLLFGLVSLSNLVIGKCGFMQATESLSLRTPFLGIQYRGCFPLAFLPTHVSRFVHATTSAEPVDATRRAAIRLLRTPSIKLRSIHDNAFGASSMVADFLERLRPEPRTETIMESARLGYSISLMTQILSERHPGLPVQVQAIRCTRLRDTQWGHIDSMVCRYAAGQHQRSVVLWGRRYDSVRSAKEDFDVASLPNSGRHIVFYSPDRRLLLEEDVGEAALPLISFSDTRLRALTRSIRGFFTRSLRLAHGSRA